jgi:cell division septum initiation protein DivIVA
MPASKSNLESMSDQIKQLRDELEVQLHLGAAEAREQWEDLEKQLGHFKSQYDRVADAAEDTAESVAEAASLAGEEILKGYKRIRSLLTK